MLTENGERQRLRFSIDDADWQRQSDMVRELYRRDRVRTQELLLRGLRVGDPEFLKAARRGNRRREGPSQGQQGTDV